MPTFEEILDCCKGKIGIYIDLKSAPVAKLIPMIRERGMEKNIVWYAGPADMRRIREQCPECNLMPDPGDEKNLPKALDTWKPGVVASAWDEMSESFVKNMPCRQRRAFHG